MPVSVVDHPADPQCGGHQWFVEDTDGLATLTAIVMVGRARQVGRILDGSERGPATKVEFCSKGVRDLLKSFGRGIRNSICS